MSFVTFSALSQTGNVGIGTTYPEQKLEIVSEDSTGVAVAIKLSAPNMDSLSKTVLMMGKDTDSLNQAEINFLFDGQKSLKNQLQFGFSKNLPFVFFNGNQRVGIGVSSPDATLHVNGDFKLADGTEGIGKILVSDTFGLATWQSPAVESDPQVGPLSMNKVPKWDGSALVDGLIEDDGNNIVVTHDAFINGLTLGKGQGSENATNTVFGFGVLGSNTLGRYNTAIGFNAMLANVMAGSSTAVGYEALRDHDGGSGGNTALGYHTLTTNLTGYGNTAVGANAMLDGTSGDNNVGIGSNAVRTYSGNGNVGVGVFSLSEIQDGEYNTAIGSASGKSAVGDANVFIGNSAGANAIGSNQLYIDNTDTDTPLIWGDFASDLLKVNGTLNINDAYDFPISDGTNGQVLSTDGAGVISWQDGGSEVESIITNKVPKWNGNALVDGLIEDNGSQVIIANDVRINNVTVGKGAGSGNGSSTAIGNGALSSNTTGVYNSAVGNSALKNNNEGSENTSLGHASLLMNIAGSQNTGIGLAALTQNISGNFNTALGYAALSEGTGNSGNTGIGSGALQEAFIGNENVAVGKASLGGENISNGNTAIGAWSGHLAEGEKNVFIGYRAGYNVTESNQLYIDNSDTSTPLIWGDFANDKVEINGTLDIKETLKLEPLAVAPGCSASDAGLLYFDSNTNKLRLCDGTNWTNLN